MAEDPQSIVPILRMIERIVAVLLGGLLTYLGYQLFLRVPQIQDGEGRFRFPGGSSVMLTRVGPGVFFALFGSVILATSFVQSVTYDPEQGFSGVASEPTVPTTTTASNVRAQYGVYVAALNSLLPAGDRTRLAPAETMELERAIRETKLALMEVVWDDELWGPLESFRDWVRSGGGSDPPRANRAAAQYFMQGLG